MKVKVIVEQAADGGFWCYTEDSVNGVGINATGATVEEAKRDFMDCVEEAKADCLEEGREWRDAVFEYKYDLQSFFNYFTFLNVSDIAARSGVNPSLMRQYSRGIKKAGEKTYKRMSACLNDITRELQAASF